MHNPDPKASKPPPACCVPTWIPELGGGQWVHAANCRGVAVDHIPCPHCVDGHGNPGRTAWGVRVDSVIDGDGQPLRLIVQPTGGAHVAADDALWLWRLIMERDGRVADRPLDLGPDGLPRLLR